MSWRSDKRSRARRIHASNGNRAASERLPTGFDLAFDDYQLRANLSNSTLRGGLHTFIAQGGKFFLRVVEVIVLSRLLAPEAFGLIAMAAVITGFASVFRDAGLSSATIQKEKVTHSQVSTLFWVNLAFSVLLAVLVAASSPIVAWVYGDQRITAIIVALSTTFLLSGSAIQHLALLRRSMRFGLIGVIEVVSMASGLACGVIAALAGADYWSIVAMQVAQSFVMASLAWGLSGWCPGGPISGTGIQSMLKYGLNMSGFNVLNFWGRKGDDLLIGLFWGAGPLGLYTRAYQLLLLPINQLSAPLTNVAIPALSRLQASPARFRAFFRRGIAVVAALGMASVAILIVIADPLIPELLGEQWRGTVPIFYALGMAAFLGTTNVAGTWVYASLGHVDRQLRWGLFATPVHLTAIAIGLPWGVLGVAIAVSVSRLIMKIPGLWICFRGTPVSLSDFWQATMAPTVAGITSVICGLAAGTGLSATGGPVWRITIASFTAVIVYVAILIVFPSGRRLYSDARMILGKARRETASE